MADLTASTALVEGLAVFAALTPPRAWSALPDRPDRVPAAGVGAATAVAAVLVLAALATDLLDLLDISASTFRLGAGIVIAIVGLYDLVTDAPRPEPALPRWKAGFVPIAFPLL